MSVETDQAEEPVAVDVRHAPARVSAIAATVAALVGTVSTVPASVVGLFVAVFGLVGVVVGLFVVSSRRLSAIGTGIVFMGVVFTGLLGADEVLVVVGVLASILAFDLSQNAFSVGAQLSTDTETWRGEAVHAAGSVAAGVVSVVLALAIYLLAGGEVAPAGLALLFVGAVVLIWAIRT